MKNSKVLAAGIYSIAISIWNISPAMAATTDLNAKSDCGAVGNGTTDFPVGTYKITSPLSISTDNITLYGSNNGTTTIVQATSSANTINISNGGSVVDKVTIRSLELYYSTQNPTGITIYCNNCWRPLFRDLSFGKTLTVGNTPHWFSNGIWAVGGNLIYVEDSRFTNTSSNGMVFQNAGEVNLMNLQVNNVVGDTAVTGLVFDGQTGGIYGTNINVTAGQTGFLFENTFGGGSSNYPAYGFFTHCLADSQNGTGWDFNTAKSMRLTNSWAATSGGIGILIENANTISIVDSRIINNGGIGIKINSGASQISIKDSMISGNSRISSGSYSGIDVAAGVSDFQILNNQIGAAGDFLATQAYGISIASGAGDNYMIIGNDLQHNATGEVSNAATGTHYVSTNNL